MPAIESEVHPDVVSNSLINIVPLALAPSFLRSSNLLLFPIIAPLKALWQAWNLYRTLGYSTEPVRYMLVQVRRQPSIAEDYPNGKEPTFDSNSCSCNHHLLSAEHRSCDRLAQFRLLDPCPQTGHRPSTCQDISTV